MWFASHNGRIVGLGMHAIGFGPKRASKIGLFVHWSNIVTSEGVSRDSTPGMWRDLKGVGTILFPWKPMRKERRNVD